MYFKEVYNVFPTLARQNFFTTDHRGLYGNNAGLSHDIDIYKKLSYVYYQKDKFNDPTYASKYIISKYKIELPDFIKVKPLSYETWKKVNNKPNQIKNIITILNECVEECYTIIDNDNNIKAFNLLTLIKKRPFFWKSLLDVIKHISTLNFDVKEQEDELAQKVRNSQFHYETSLDGLYDIFVYSNFPDQFIWYKSLDSESRLDILGFYQSITKIDVQKNLNLFRTGKMKTVILKPGSQQDRKSLNEKLGEQEQEAVNKSKQELAEAIRREKFSNKKVKINTSAENSEFINPDS